MGRENPCQASLQVWSNGSARSRRPTDNLGDRYRFWFRWKHAGDKRLTLVTNILCWVNDLRFEWKK